MPRLHDGSSHRNTVDLVSIIGGEVGKILELGGRGKPRIEQRPVPDITCYLPRIASDGNCCQVESFVRNPRVGVNATLVSWWY